MILRIIKDELHRASFNMALDEVLFVGAQAVEDPQPVVRFYGFDSPAITVGRCQKLREDDAMMKCIEKGADITRRITGGGIVFHENDVTFSLIAKITMHEKLASLEASYKVIHQCVYDVMKDMQCDVSFHASKKNVFVGRGHCFTTPVNNDVMIGEEKIVGGAQKRNRGVLLHQGSISLSGVDPEKKNIRSLQNDVRDKLAQALSALFTCFGKEEGHTKEEYDEALILERDKYAREDWVLRR